MDSGDFVSRISTAPSTTAHYRKRPSLRFAGGGRAAQPGRCHGGEGRAPRGDALRAAVAIPRPWCWMPGGGWWLVPGKPATLPPPTTAHSRRESLRSPAAPLPPEENRANSSPTVQGEVLATRANFSARICTGNFSPKTSQCRFPSLPVQLPVQISRHFGAFSGISEGFRA